MNRRNKSSTVSSVLGPTVKKRARLCKKHKLVETDILPKEFVFVADAEIWKTGMGLTPSLDETIDKEQRGLQTLQSWRWVILIKASRDVSLRLNVCSDVTDPPPPTHHHLPGETSEAPTTREPAQKVQRFVLSHSFPDTRLFGLLNPMNCVWLCITCSKKPFDTGGVSLMFSLCEVGMSGCQVFSIWLCVLPFFG